MPAWVIGGSALISGALGKSAADEEAGAIGAGTKEGKRQFDLQWGAMAPQREAGTNALARMAMMTGAENPMIAINQAKIGENVQAFRDRGYEMMNQAQRTRFAGKMGAGSWRQLTDDQIMNYMQGNIGEVPSHTNPEMRKFHFKSQELFKDTAQLREGLAKAEQPFDFKTTPGYEFRTREGQEGVENYLSSTNRRMGGSAIKAIEDYRQGAASNEFGNVFNQAATIAGYAPAASRTPSNQIPQMMAQQGAAGAGKYSAYNNAIQGGIQNYLSYDAARQSQPNTYTTDYSLPMTSREF